MEYDIEQLKSPDHVEQFNAVMGGKFHQRVDLSNEAVDVDQMTESFNQVVIGTTAEILGKYCRVN